MFDHKAITVKYLHVYDQQNIIIILKGCALKVSMLKQTKHLYSLEIIYAN